MLLTFRLWIDPNCYFSIRTHYKGVLIPGILTNSQDPYLCSTTTDNISTTHLTSKCGWNMNSPPGLGLRSLWWEIRILRINYKSGKSSKPLLELIKPTFRVLYWKDLKATAKSRQHCCPVLQPLSYSLQPPHLPNAFWHCLSI